LPLPDVSAFRRLLLRNPAGFFGGPGEVIVTRAPGRIDLMGGIADYSGSLVLESTTAEAALVGLRRREDDRLRVRSHGIEREGLAPQFEMRLADLYSGRRLRPTAQVAAIFSAEPLTHWAGYLLGNFHILLREKVVPRLAHGADLLLSSSVPMGAGVASSAALEVAAMQAICVAYGITLDGLKMARLCQMVENQVVGAPCGIMDQVTIALGQERKLLALLCQPHDVQGLHELPAGCQVIGVNSRVKHSVGGSKYTRARVAAFMGRRIIDSLLADDRARPAADRRGRLSYPKPEAVDHLANITPEEFRRRFYARLPGKMKGSEFLRRHGETGDSVTTVDPEMTYSVRGCTEHPIYENWRVREFIRLLDRARETGREKHLIRAGRLMYASHWSYGSRCALGAPETDLIVRLVKQRGPEKGFYGAKITGGGSGGTVAVLAAEGVEDEIEAICAQYEAATGAHPQVLRGSSPGALAFGCEKRQLS
jgi:galactokinase